MTIHGGNILHHGRGFLIDRIQNTGTTLGLTPEKIRELGNRLAVTTIRENPDITFTMESFDFSTEIEALLCRADPTTVIAGQELDLVTASRPMDIVSPYVDPAFNSVRAVGLPYLYLEQIDWRFAVRQSASKRIQLRGDSILYSPGSMYYQKFGPTASAGPHNFTNGPATLFVDQGLNAYALCVSAFYADNTVKRLFLGQDFTNTASGFTLLVAPPAGTVLEVMYASATTSNFPQSIHPSNAVKPGSVRHRNVDVYVSNGAATPTLIKIQGLQSCEMSLRLTTTVTEELGNAHTVSRDAEDPEFTGNLVMRPRDAAYLFDFVAQAANVVNTQVVGPLSSKPLAMQVRVSNPETSAVIQTFQCDDARFLPPGPNPQVGQPLEVTIPFESDTGKVRVFNGAPL